MFGEDPPNTARFPNAAGAALRRLDSSEKIMSGRPGRAPVLPDSNPGFEPSIRTQIRTGEEHDTPFLRGCQRRSGEPLTRDLSASRLQDRGTVDEK
ncbi:MAG: hypothetical protein DSY81_03530 [Bacillota bacterium]|nr:MAG: hypothetical protein DSY92_10885 [Planctomycetota bacterium]RUA10397.1 MAG: hypothetical protein DSY81_03530 [Bacillota bacterium]